jgi:hypothetical protein
MEEENIKGGTRTPFGTRNMGNKKLRGLQKDLDIVVDIKQKRLVWIEHLVRMDHGSELENIFESKPEGRRRITRPKLFKRIF